MESNRKEQIFKVIAGAEKRVLGFLAEAASDGDYELIDFARRAATGLHHLGIALTSRSVGNSTMKFDAQTVRRPELVTESKKSGTREKKMKSRSYPLFAVRDNSLVKTGWSKREGSTYEQRVPRRTFEMVLLALAEVAKRDSDPVATDSILEIVNASDNPPPSYQSYAVLAFLRAESEIRQVRRGEYAIPKDVEVNALAAWDRVE